MQKQQQQQLSTTAATDGNSANTPAKKDTITVATANDIETVRAPTHDGTTVKNISTFDHEQHPRDNNCGANHASSSVVTTATA
jgi:hypothetical protein